MHKSLPVEALPINLEKSQLHEQPSKKLQSDAGFFNLDIEELRDDPGATCRGEIIVTDDNIAIVNVNSYRNGPLIHNVPLTRAVSVLILD